MNLPEILPVESSRPIGVDDSVDLAIIIPTVATPSVVVPTVRRLVEVAPARTRVILSINPKVPEDGDRVEVACASLRRLAESRGVDLRWHREDGLRGFGGAINIGTRYQIRRFGGLPRFLAIWNDDLIATPGSIERTVAAFSTDEIGFFGDLPDEKGRRPRKPVARYGRIGQVGPVTNVVGGNQRVDPKDRIERLGLDGFAEAWGSQFDGDVIAAEFLSGFCMFWTRECFLELSLHSECGTLYRGIFDADRYPVAGYEDNDLCARVERSGYRSAVAWSAFVLHRGHQTFDSMFPEWQRGMRNRLAYLEKWRPVTGRRNKIAGVQRVRVSTVQDLHLWRHSILRSASLLDGLAVLLTGSPAAILGSAGFDRLAPSLPPVDRELLADCASCESESEVAEVVERWIEVLAQRARGSADFVVAVDFWTGQWNERDERNSAIELAEGLTFGDGRGVDWLLSIDHDEVIEDRISRPLLDRWTSHPDPLVQVVETGWLNHWEGGRMVRIDRPWGDGGTYRGGMAGPRLWRVNRANPRRILHGNEKGLHCGNAPLTAFPSVRVSGFRFRHYGYVDPVQRRRKRSFYDAVDPNPDPVSIGGQDYGHITDDEGMTLRPYVAANGIGLFMLAHAGEDVEGIARILDSLYLLVDRMVLVWTDDWTDEDKRWTDDGVDGFEFAETTTGPGADLARLSSLYGVEWVHQPLDFDLASARNAGIDALRKYRGEGLGWALFLDPDEHFSDDYRPLRALRSMAEVSRGWGWMFRFANVLRSGGASYSESVRMFRLDPEGVMRMSGRVHEGFDRAFEDLRSRGEHPGIKYAPFSVTHLGLAKSDDEIERKLARYRTMLRLELADNPHAPGAWTSLGMQYLNDGDEDRALACFERGILVAGSSYLPFKEAAYWHLRRGRAYLAEAVRLTVPGHPVRKAMEPLADALAEAVPDLPKVGSKRLDPLDLPEFPIPSSLLAEPATAAESEE